MAQRGILEFDAKKILSKNLSEHTFKGFLVKSYEQLQEMEKKHSWTKKEKLVAKIDQLVGKRGKHGLVLAGKPVSKTKKWIKQKMGKTIVISGKKGNITTFLVEPFFSHSTEYYLAFDTERENDVILFSLQGGIDIEENWDKVRKLKVSVLKEPSIKEIRKLVKGAKQEKHLALLIKSLFEVFRKLHFSYLEINPLGFNGKKFEILDCVARLDDTALFVSEKYIGKIGFPEPFGSNKTIAEKKIEKLDRKTGASLKLKILNPNGRIWLMVAGGGASVIFADTVADLGEGGELANYGEYSGDPSMEFTYQYALTVINEMLKAKTKNKVLLIGGGIANFTDVAETFKGIIKAIKEKAKKIKKQKIKIFVRRGGPHYKEGLERMKELGKELSIPIIVHNPKHMMTEIVSIAIKKKG